MQVSKLFKWVTVGFVLLLAMSAASAVLAAGPTGASPNDPLMVPTDSQTIAPNTTLWFYFDYALDGSSGGFFGRAPRPSSSTGSKINITIDANGNKNLQFGLFTPTQATDWLRDASTAPIGRGTPYTDTSNDLVIHDLYWSGAFNLSGRYFVAVTNNGASAIAFRMTVTGDAVTLYPVPTAVPSPTLNIPFSVTPVPTTTVQGKILFETATGGEIYAVNGDGSNLTRISRGIDPSWSADGKKITFARWDNSAPGVYIANADGSNEQIIFTAPRVRWPRFSPDGKYVVFAQDKTKDDRNIIWKLGLVEVATGKLTEPQCSQLCFTPSWAQDSTTIVYADPNVGIMQTSILGGPASLIMGPSGSYWDSAAGFARPILHMPQIQDAELSPDGKTIAYAQPAADRWEVSQVSIYGGVGAGVTTFDPVVYYLFNIAVHNVAPTWSPDGKQIMFLSDRNGKWEFFVTNPDGSNVRQVLKNVTDQVPVKFTYENERMLTWTSGTVTGK